MIELRVPSKTFLVGEYAVLQGAPALIATTKPFFRFSAKKLATGSQRCLFEKESPAGCWFHQSDVLLRDWSVAYHDPHAGKGGFGASGAQFVFYHALTTYLQSKRTAEVVRDVWQDFRACDGSGGSGADVVSQLLGGITCFRAEPFEAQSGVWPFNEVGFVILRTGDKLATHAHLKTLDVESDELIDASEAAVIGFLENDLDRFLQGLSEFQLELHTLDLQTARSKELVDLLMTLPGVYVAKGCGAMGADTVLAVFDRSKELALMNELSKKDLLPVATSDDLAPPLSLELVN